MSIVDNAIQRLQVIANATLYENGKTFKNTPPYPTDDSSILPLAIAHLGSGKVTEMNATDTKFEININVDFHFDRAILRLTYQKIDYFIPDFIQRLGGDPTLGGTVSTIQFPATFTVGSADWDSVITQMVSFIIPVKFNLLTPTVTP
jgi:hypothetical protein